MKSSTHRRLKGASPRAFARAVTAIRWDSVAHGTDAVSMAQIDREVAAVRSRRSRASKRTADQR